MIQNSIAAVAGLAIILIVASDIFRSLLVPRANTRLLRVAPVLGAFMFPSWQAMARGIGPARMRQTVLASLAPLLLVMTLMSWAGSLILGFGFVFWADRANFRPGFATYGDAIYAAGSAFSTLGINGTVTGTLTRAAVLTCSVAGLAIVTVVATFLISIQAAFSRRETLVLRLESHVTLPPAGIAILETYIQESIVERLGPFFEAWELWTTEIAISHQAFPILLFFRSNDSRCEWLAALGAVMDAAALLDAAIADPPAEARAGAHFLLRTGARVLQNMADQFGVAGDTPALVDAKRFGTHRDRLSSAGYRLVDDDQASFERFKELRRTYAGPLVTLARRLRIAVDERTGDDLDSKPHGQ